MIKKVLLIFLMLFLVTTPLVLGAPVVHSIGPVDVANPRPTIDITYTQPDTPLIIEDITLYDANGVEIKATDGSSPIDLLETDTLYPVNPDATYADEWDPEGSDAWDYYKYQVTEFLPNGKYKLIINGKKYHPTNDGADHLVEVTMNLKADDSEIWITKPLEGRFFNPEDRTIALGDETLFDLEIKTRYNSICTIQKTIPTSKTIHELYSKGNWFNNKDGVKTQTHTIKVLNDEEHSDVAGSLDAKMYLPIREEFDYAAIEQSKYVIICSREDGENISKTVYVGYDTSSPVISTEYDPLIIIDPNKMETTLNVSSQGDFIDCAYRFYEQPNVDISKKTLPETLTDLSFYKETLDDYTVYDEVFFDMNTIEPAQYQFNKAYPFRGEVVCRNLAGKETTQDMVFYVNLTSDIEYTILAGKTLYGDYYNYTSDPATILFETNIQSICSYEYKDQTYDIDTEESTLHEFKLDVEENQYGINVTLACTALGFNFPYEEKINLTIDTKEPSAPTLVSESHSCNGDLSVDVSNPINNYVTLPYGDGDMLSYSLELYVEGDASPIGVGVLSTFRDEGFEISQSDVDLTTTLDFGLTYTWKVAAMDGVGNVGPSSSTTIKRLNTANNLCDDDAPTGTHTATLGLEGYEVYVECQDTENHCDGSYDYSITPLVDVGDNDCSTIPFSKTGTLLDVISFSEDSLFCYRVKDTADPDVHYSKNYSVKITPENNIQLINPISGISPDTAFDFIVETQSLNDRDSSCKQGYVTSRVTDLLAKSTNDAYKEIYELPFANDFTGHEGNRHNISFSDILSLHSDKFNSGEDIISEPWFVVCKEDNVELYYAKTFDLGYDLTDPEITFLDIIPKPLQNPEDLSGLLQVETNEDTYCKYSLPKEEELSFASFASTYNQFETYTTTHEARQVYEYEDSPLSVVQEIRCYNLAGRETTETLPYDVKAKGSLEINHNLAEYSSSKQVNFEVTTPGLPTNCDFSVVGENVAFSTSKEYLVSGTTVHSVSTTLSEGNHTIVMSCEANFFGSRSQTSSWIFVDETAPSVSASVLTPTCSLSQVDITFSTSQGESSALVSKQFQIRNKQGENLSELRDINFVNAVVGNFNEPFTHEETYELWWFAQDKAGNEASDHVDFLAANGEHVACDNKPPIATFSHKDVYGGMEFIIGCEDPDSSGCNLEEFYYYYDDTGVCGTTNSDDVQVGRYDELPLFKETSSTICYFVKDNANLLSKEKSFSFEIDPACSNQKYDEGSESGVDCGGTCPLQDCNVCYNDVWDEDWEDSLNCGGVCSNLCIDGDYVPLSITLEYPPRGVADSRNFDFTIKTNRQATCRYELDDARVNAPPGLRYDNMLESYEQFTTDFKGLVHTVSVDGDALAGASGLEDFYTDIYIVCKERDAHIPKKVIDFGFDTTPAYVEVWAEPNPTKEPIDLQSTLYVTTDDLTACTFLDKNRDPVVPTPFGVEDPLTLDTYETSRETILSYALSDGDDEQEIVCYNLAGTPSYNSTTIEVKPKTSTAITIHNDEQYYTRDDGEIILDVSTDVLGECEYVLDPNIETTEADFTPMELVNPAFDLFGVSLSKTHEKTLSGVSEGNHSVLVRCGLPLDFLGLGKENIAHFTQDSSSPELLVTVSDSTCSFNSIAMDIKATDDISLIDSLQYKVLIPGEEEPPFLDVLTSSFDLSVALDSHEEETIEVLVEATNAAGLTTPFRKEILVVGPNHISCDGTAPTMTYTLEDAWGGYDLTVSCQEDHDAPISGCVDNFAYSFFEEGTCDDTDQFYPLDTPLLLDRSGTICFRVYDEQLNYGDLETLPIAVYPHCYNDGWDEGEDPQQANCGGECPISCEDINCDDGIQGQYEEGPDCGPACGIACPIPVDPVSLCSNGIRDEGEVGEDCGGACPACKLSDFRVDLVYPHHGVSYTEDFDFVIETTLESSCKFSKYTSSMDKYNEEELYSLFKTVTYPRVFSTNDGFRHTLAIDGDVFAENDYDGDSYITQAIIVCEVMGDYRPHDLPFFGFDISPPTYVDVYAEPEPTQDPADLTSVLHVETDDLSVCTYLSKDAREPEYFLPEDFFTLSSYATTRETTLDYFAEDKHTDEQEVACTNLAGNTTYRSINILVDPLYSPDITVLNDGEYYNDKNGNILIQVETTNLATCRFGFNDAALNDFEDLNQIASVNGLAYQHEKRITGVEDGEHSILVECKTDDIFEGAPSYKPATFTQDSQDPLFSLTLAQNVCVQNSLYVDITASDDVSGLDTFEYAVLFPGEETITYQDVTQSSILVSDSLESYLGEDITVYARAKDNAGNLIFDDAQARVIDLTQGTCDGTAPTVSSQLQDVWGGVNLSVTCFDDHEDPSGCYPEFSYQFTTETTCGDIYESRPLGTDIFIEESGLVCYYVKDNAGNPSTLEFKSVSVNQACYNDVWNVGEDFKQANCGGDCVSCQDVDEICNNEHYDVGLEEGEDCGGICTPTKGICTDGDGGSGGDDPIDYCNDGERNNGEVGEDCGGECSACTLGDFALDIVTPFNGVSKTRNFDFVVETTLDSQCRFMKYDAVTADQLSDFSDEEVYAQIDDVSYQRVFTSFDGFTHTISLDGESFAGADVKTYMSEIRIYCQALGEIVDPIDLEFFGFDVTPPKVNAWAEPNPTEDPANLKSTLYVETDDLSVCKYVSQETGEPVYFSDDDYFKLSTYGNERDVLLNYWGTKIPYDDVQEISCENLAGWDNYTDVIIKVQPKYSPNINILNDGKYYNDRNGQVTLEVETTNLATCQYKFSENGNPIALDKENPQSGLAYRHTKKVTVEDGNHTLFVECGTLNIFDEDPEKQVANFIQDKVKPELSVTLVDNTCSLAEVKLIATATDEVSKVDIIEYQISYNGDVVVPYTQVTSNPIVLPLNLADYLGDSIDIDVRVYDKAGNVETFDGSSFVTDPLHPGCDVSAPTMDYDLTEVYSKGYTLDVECFDEHSGASGCDTYYNYYFAQDGVCGELDTPQNLGRTLELDESGTVCFRVHDKQLNLGPLGEESFVIEDTCSNEEHDPDEDDGRVDCGGECPACEYVDDLCDNGNYDVGLEEGEDCGGICTQINGVCTDGDGGSDGTPIDYCSDGVRNNGEAGEDCGGECSECTLGDFDLTVTAPFNGVSKTKNFDFVVETTLDSQCRFSKYYDSFTDFSDEELFVDFTTTDGYTKEFSSSDGFTHTISMDGVAYAGADGDSYIAPGLIICKTLGDYVLVDVPYFGYDTTKPNFIVAEANPEPVIDPANPNTRLTVTTDDLSVCMYTDRLADPNPEQVYFDTDNYFDLDTYSTSRNTNFNYWGTKQSFSDVQEISCENLAGWINYTTVSIDVAPTYSPDITILNDGKYYNDRNGRVTREVETVNLATCKYRLNSSVPLQPLNGVDKTRDLAYKHTVDVILEDNNYSIEVQCGSQDFFESDPQVQVGSFIVDRVKPELYVSVINNTCSLDQIAMDVSAVDALSMMDSLEYSISHNGDVIVPLSSIPTTQFILPLDLSSYLDSEIDIEIIARDKAGNINTFDGSSFVTDPLHPGCDVSAPTMDYELEKPFDVYELDVECFDEHSGASGCDTYYNYYFAQDGACGELDTPQNLGRTLELDESGTVCFRVHDKQLNYGPLGQEPIVIEDTCFNDVHDPGEDEGRINCGGDCIACEYVDCNDGKKGEGEVGIDCGGVCLIEKGECSVDSASCNNGDQDLGEEGIDCGIDACGISCEEAENLAFEVQLRTPKFGIATTKDFTLEVYTTRDAVCEQGWLPGESVRPDEGAGWFRILDNFESTNGRLHGVPIISEQINGLNGNENQATTQWIVVCNEKNTDNYDVMFIDEFGYDISPADISVVAVPNPVVDPVNSITTLSVSSDDPIACTYLDEDGNSHYFGDSHSDKKETYDTSFSADITYFNTISPDTHENMISCVNIAQGLQNIPYNISIAFSDEVSITSNMKDLYSEKSVTLDILSDHVSTCTYTLDSDDEPHDMSTENSYQHTATSSFDQGDHTVKFYCVSESTGEDDALTVRFSVDIEEPTLEITTPEDSCGLEEISFSVIASGTGSDIASYNYVLTLDDEEIKTGSSSKPNIDISVDLEDGKTYVLEVEVEDEAGHSAFATKSIVASKYDPLACDTTAPSGTLKIDPAWNGYYATVVCQDESQCTDTFEYSFSEDTACQGEIQNPYYEDLPIHITEETYFCYTVYDKAGNSFSDYEHVGYIAHCFNDQKDPAEEGFNCGGDCIAECGTCDNNEKDDAEEGVDCGVVCGNSCDDISGDYGVDSDGDGLPDAWEEEHFGNIALEDGEGDPDGDGLSNEEEYLAGTDPNEVDSDGDGMPDSWEVEHFGNDDENPEDDYDGDGLNNGLEYELGLDPTVDDVIDVDGDGLADQWEEYFFNDLDEVGGDDYDSDGLSNEEEYLAGTDPTTSDRECEIDEDCLFGFRCDAYVCIEDDFYADDPELETVEGSNILGVIFIILGFLLMGGGIGYIYYSRKQLAEAAAKQKQQSFAQQEKSRAAQLAEEQRKEEQRRKILEKRREAQEKARKQKIEERKKLRESLIGSFDQKEQSSGIDEPLQPKKPSKLDDGFNEDFVDVRDLGNGGKPHKTALAKPKPIDEVNKNVFKELASISKKTGPNTKKIVQSVAPSSSATAALKEMVSKSGTSNVKSTSAPKKAAVKSGVKKTTSKKTTSSKKTATKSSVKSSAKKSPKKKRVTKKKTSSKVTKK